MTALSLSVTDWASPPAHVSSAPFGMTGLVANQPHGQVKREILKMMAWAFPSGAVTHRSRHLY